MKAREGVMKSEAFGSGKKRISQTIFSLLNNYIAELKKLYPVVEPNLSDSGSVDCCLEFLAIAGERSLPEVNICQISVYSS